MEKIYGIMPERKLWVNLVVGAFGVYVCYYAAMSAHYYYILFGLVMILAAGAKRQHVVSEEGADIQFTVFGVRFHSLWKWAEVQTLHTDAVHSRPNVELHIGKGVISRRFIMSPDDCKRALEMGQGANGDIYVSEIRPGVTREK